MKERNRILTTYDLAVMFWKLSGLVKHPEDSNRYAILCFWKEQDLPFDFVSMEDIARGL